MFSDVGLMWVPWLAIITGLVLLVFRGRRAARESGRSAKRRPGNSENSS